VRWRCSESLLFNGGLEINSHRFLLDVEGETIALRDYRVPLFIGLEYAVAARFALTLRLCYDVSRSITYDDEGDDELQFESDGVARLSGGFTWYF